MRDRLAKVESERAELLLERDSLLVRLDSISKELETYKITGEMQSEEIKRLTERGLVQPDESGNYVTKATVIKLAEKVEQIRFSYLEKDREATVLKN